jgi:peptide/nickel transport system permease protein
MSPGLPSDPAVPRTPPLEGAAQLPGHLPAEPGGKTDGNAAARGRQPRESYWRVVWRQFRRRPRGLIGLGIIAVITLVALFSNFLAGDVPIHMVKGGKTYWFPNVITYAELKEQNLYANFDRWQPGEGESARRPPIPHGPTRQDLRNRLQPPSRDHLLGTDDRGRDVLSRLIHASRVAISVGIVAVGIAVVIGVVLGAAAGYYGGWVDSAVLRAIETMMVFPTFFFILTVIAFLPPSIYNIMVVIGLTEWAPVARLVRGEVLRERGQDYATAARATGLSTPRIIFRHILPNAISPVFVHATFGVAGAILAESALSFLGFGIQPPAPSWGELLKQGQVNVRTAWWLVTFPGIAIFTTVTAFNLVGETLRDAMDPKLRQ